MLQSKKVQMALAGLLAALVLSFVPELEAQGLEQQTIDTFMWIVPRLLAGVGGLIGTYWANDALSMYLGLQGPKAPPAREVNLGDATH